MRMGAIIDDMHRTLPFITKYERTRILGIRAKQLNNGAKPFITLRRRYDGWLYNRQTRVKRKKKSPLLFVAPYQMEQANIGAWKI